MIYLGFPIGSDIGWGVLGKEVVLAMAQLADVRLLPQPNDNQRIVDEFELFQIRKLLAMPKKHGRRIGSFWKMDGPVIQIAQGPVLEPYVPVLAPPTTVGFAVFEANILAPSVIARIRQQYCHLAAGSSYCADVLRQHGFSEVSTILHGVDTNLFSPRSERRSFFPDHFIVFSGGKFELRKGQDIVIRAYKVLQDRHRDVMLVNSWYNGWPQFRDTMSASAHIRYVPLKNNDYAAWMNDLLFSHGVDIERVITVFPRPHRLLPDLYHSTDLGLFPNRVEGGNNMVLMEYLACGKPAIASFNSGHTDILRRENAVLIESHRPLERCNAANEVTAVWNDPSLEETIEKLEWCYQNRDQLQSLAQQAAADMRKRPWKRVAEELLEVLRCAENIQRDFENREDSSTGSRQVPLARAPAMIHSVPPWNTENSKHEFANLLPTIRPYTLLSEVRLVSLFNLALYLCLNDVPGNFVECGTWRGGVAAMLAYIIKHHSKCERRLYCFDTFAGMPEPTEVDKHRGIPANLTPFGAGSLGAPMDIYLLTICRLLDVTEFVVPFQGLFADTLPARKEAIGSIALLHADADWYESTLTILENLYDKVEPGCFVQIDDYGHWEGCKKAVHDFERQRDLSFALHAIDLEGVWLKKDA